MVFFGRTKKVSENSRMNAHGTFAKTAS